MDCVRLLQVRRKDGALGMHVGTDFPDIVDIDPAGGAAVSSDLRIGDLILAVDGRTTADGTPITELLTPGKQSYRILVERSPPVAQGGGYAC